MSTFKPDKEYEKKEKKFQKEGNQKYIKHELAEVREAKKNAKKGKKKGGK